MHFKFQQGEPVRKLVYYAIGLVFALLAAFGVVTAEQANSFMQAVYDVVLPFVAAGVSGFAGAKVHRGSDSVMTEESVAKAIDFVTAANRGSEVKSDAPVVA